MTTKTTTKTTNTTDDQAAAAAIDHIRIVLPVADMTCASCVARVEKALGAADGVAAASVNFAAETATVDFDPQRTDVDGLARVIGEAGYRVPVAAVRLAIGGMTCATCAGRVEKALKSVAGVESAQVNLATETATVAVAPGTATEALVQAVTAAGYEAAPAPSAQAEREAADRVEAARSRREALVLGGAALLTLPLVAPMVLAPFGLTWSLSGWAQLALATPVQFVAGTRFYRGAWAATRSRTANMDTLVALGTTAAFALSLFLLPRGGHLYFEGAAAIITFVRIGKWLESRAKHATTRAIRALMDLRPETARVKRDGREIEVPAEAVGRGEVVVIRPGERVPVDGRVVAGASQLDESLLTGESLPVARDEGDDVTAGSINGDGLLEVACELQHRLRNPRIGGLQGRLTRQPGGVPSVAELRQRPRGGRHLVDVDLVGEHVQPGPAGCGQRFGE